MLNCVIQSTFFHKLKDKKCNVTHVHTMKAYGGHLYGGQWSTSCLEEGNNSTNLIGGWVGPRNGLATLEKRKISSPSQKSNSSVTQSPD
jgi:hypothetical protein